MGSMADILARGLPVPDIAGDYYKLQSLARQKELGQLQIQNEQRQGQLSDLALTRARQAELDDQQSREFYRTNPNATDAEAISALGQRALPMIKARREAASAALDQQIKQGTLNLHNANRKAVVAGTIKDQPSFEAGVNTLLREGVITPQEAQRELSIGYTPEMQQQMQWYVGQGYQDEAAAHDAAIKDAVEKRNALLAGPQLQEAQDKAVTSGLGAFAQGVDQIGNQDQWTAARNQITNPRVKALIPAMYSPAAAEQVKRSIIPVKDQPEFDIKQRQLQTGAAGNTEFDQFMVKYSQSLGKNPNQLTSGEFNAGMQKFKQFSQDPALRDLAIAQKQTALAQQAANAGPPKPIEPGSPQYKVAQDLAYGRLPFSQFRTLYAYSRDSNAKLGIYQLAGELNPNFNPAAFEMGFKFASNPKTQAQLASLDNVVRGVPDLLAISDKASRTGVPLINKFVIPGGIALGGKKYSDFNTAQTAFADELSGALGYGSATDMSREMGFNMTDKSLSPDAFRSAIQNVIMPFIDRKRGSMLNQMGVYGQPGMNPAAQPATAAPAGGKAITVRDPRGVVHTFPTQKAADDFKQAAGIQ
jgi:hypothetical protein